MVANPDGDVAVVQNLANIVGMNAVHLKRQHPHLVPGSPNEADAVDAGKNLGAVAR